MAKRKIGHIKGSYKKYLDAYMIRQKTLERKGYSMEFDMLSKEQFKYEYKRYYNTRMQQLKSGEKKKFGNIYGEMASAQVSKISQYQAQKIKEVANKMDIKMSLSRIRRGDPIEDKKLSQFWSNLSNAYQEYKEMGMAVEDIIDLMNAKFWYPEDK